MHSAHAHIYIYIYARKTKMWVRKDLIIENVIGRLNYTKQQQQLVTDLHKRSVFT